MQYNILRLCIQRLTRHICVVDKHCNLFNKTLAILKHFNDCLDINGRDWNDCF